MMNWTTTQLPTWQTDCTRFLELRRPFELWEIRTPEHEEFVKSLSEKNNLKITRFRPECVRFEMPS